MNETIYRITFCTLLFLIISLIFILIILKIKEKTNKIKNMEEKVLEYKNKGSIFINRIGFINKYIKNLNELKYNKINIKYKKYFNFTFILLISIIIFATIYIIIFSITHVYSFSFLCSIPFLFLSNIIVNILLNNYREKLIRSIPSYIINLKNYIEVDNNIVEAISKVTCPIIMKPYINKFNISVKKGLNTITAFENLKKDINIDIITELISLLQICYIYGGNYKSFLDRYQTNINKIIIEKEKTAQELFSSNLVLTFMTIINVYILITYIFSNNEYKILMTNSIIGVIILNLNIISFYIILLIIIKIRKLEV